MSERNLLALRDIHMPDPISFWPQAPGWWLALGGAVICIIVFLLVRKIFNRQSATYRAALRELKSIEKTFRTNADATLLATRTSLLLRRFALARFPRHQVAGKIGEPWLVFLDQHGGQGNFASGPGRTLISAPYQHRAEFDAGKLLALVRNWITVNR